MTVRGYAGRLNGGFCHRVGVLPEQIASVPLLEQNVVLARPRSVAARQRRANVAGSPCGRTSNASFTG
jgi:hypothetical protein